MGIRGSLSAIIHGFGPFFFCCLSYCSCNSFFASLYVYPEFLFSLFTSSISVPAFVYLFMFPPPNIYVFTYSDVYVIGFVDGQKVKKCKNGFAVHNKGKYISIS